MKNNEICTFMDQLIQHTKDNSLSWLPYQTLNIELKPLPSDPLTPTTILKEIAQANTLSAEKSFICQYNDGYFFLLLYKGIMSDTNLELRVQTKGSLYSKVYAKTSPSAEPVEIISRLKRLYNLVSNSAMSSDIDAFVNTFIENE